MNQGIYKLSNKIYHQSAGVSKSGLALLRKTPAHYAAKYIHGIEEERTKGMIIGSALHKLVLEPDAFDDEYAVAPKCDKRTTAGKADWARFVEQAGDKEVIEKDDHDLISMMRDSVMAHAGASYLLGLEGHAEESFYWIDETAGALCKCRPDWRVPSERMIVDLKSCEDAGADGFARSIATYTYHIQAAMYLDGVSRVMCEQYTDFVFIAVEKTPPFAVAVYHLMPTDIEQGRYEFQTLLELYTRCMNRNEWPGYPDTIQSISLPKWAVPKDLSIWD